MSSIDSVKYCRHGKFYIYSIWYYRVLLFNDWAPQYGNMEIWKCIWKIWPKIWKYIIRTLWENLGLEITITTNLMIVNFLDITFDSCTERYQPYTKPNDTLTYISVNSNHPLNIIKELPDSTSERIFHPIKQHLITPRFSITTYYLQAGIKKILLKDLPLSNRVKQRKIIWFNPP